MSHSLNTLTKVIGLTSGDTRSLGLDYSSYSDICTYVNGIQEKVQKRMNTTTYYIIRAPGFLELRLTQKPTPSLGGK